MLYKPLVALFMAFAATCGVAASTTPVRRGGGYPQPPSTNPAGGCNTNTNAYCCNAATSASNPVVGAAYSILLEGTGLLTGPSCENIGLISSPTCDASSLCCANTQNNGLINVDCNKVSL